MSWVGHDQFAAELRLDDIFERLGRLLRLDQAIVVDDPDDRISVSRPELGVDRFLREVFEHGGVIPGHDIFFEEEAHLGIVHKDHVN